MPDWFRKGLSPYQTALAMIGAKAGDRVIVLGADDPNLSAELALVTGLNGQTTVCDDRPGARERVEAAAANAGALVDFASSAQAVLMKDGTSCDVAVIMGRLGSLDEARRTTSVMEALRVLRPGGRVVVSDGERRSGLAGVLKGRPRRLTPEEVLALLERAGAKARRQLADVDGVAFYEGRKATL